MNEKLLSSLDLSPKEIAIYKAVLKAGSSTPSALTQATKLKRTTAYSIARGLAEKGLLNEDATKRPRIFTIASPQEVRDIVSGERKRLDMREKVFKQLADELSKDRSSKSYPVPHIRFIEEDKIVPFLHKEMPVWDKSLMSHDATWWGFQDHTLIEHYLNVIDWHWRQAPKEYILKLLTNQSIAEAKLRGRYPRRNVKFWNKSQNFITTTWVAGDYVIMLNTRRHPFYLVEIHDATLAHDQREVFKNLWAMV
jgi:predicted transcriptional regulator